MNEIEMEILKNQIKAQMLVDYYDRIYMEEQINFRVKRMQENYELYSKKDNNKLEIL